MPAIILLAILPLLVAPSFLDYAQEAKAVGLHVLAAAGLLAALWRPRDAARLAAALTSPPVLLLAVTWIWGIALAAQPLAAAHAVRNEALGLGAALLVAVYSPSRRTALRALVAGAAVVAAIGLCQVAFDWRALTPAGDPGQFPGVTFGNRGLASLFVALGILPALTLRAAAASRRLRLRLDAALALQGLFVFVTMTRAVWLGLILALLLRQVLKVKPTPDAAPEPRPVPTRARFLARTAAAAGVLALLAAGVLLVVSNDALRTLVAQRLDATDWLRNPRFGLWAIMARRFAAAPPSAWLFGLGAGSFQILSPGWLAGSPLDGRTFLDAHNDFLQVLVEFGALGLAVRAALIGAALKRLVARGDAAFAGNAVLIAASALLYYPLHLPYFIALFGFFLIAPPAPRAHTAAWLRPAAALAAALLLALAVQRARLETGMRAVVKGDEPALVRLARAAELRDEMRFASAPALYRRLVQPRGE